ncbi:MAG: hypothetical protein KME27_14970 [Lyngbya sp. HA4199-MV5]|nr:hypothetical protein [Lyngbya sp. HA4199-MV5]
MVAFQQSWNPSLITFSLDIPYTPHPVPYTLHPIPCTLAVGRSVDSTGKMLIIR